jgi:hypothetical protein
MNISTIISELEQTGLIRLAQTEPELKSLSRFISRFMPAKSASG